MPNVTEANIAGCCVGKLLRESNLKVLITKIKTFFRCCFYMSWWMIAKHCNYFAIYANQVIRLHTLKLPRANYISMKWGEKNYKKINIFVSSFIKERELTLIASMLMRQQTMAFRSRNFKTERLRRETRLCLLYQLCSLGKR